MFNETKTISIAAYEQTWIDGLNRGDLSVAKQVFHEDCTIHINGGPQKELSLDEFTQMLKGFLVAFPDLNFHIDDTVVSGNKVSFRWTAQGTHLGPVGDMPATGNALAIDGLIIDHLVDGKVANRWELWDQASMLQQLGIIP